MLIHTIFDVAASLSSIALTFLCYRWRLRDAALRIDAAGPIYALALIGGAVLGGYGMGTLNLWLGGVHEVARSIVGALAGAILAIELFKRWRGIHGSTGLIFVPAFCATVIVGRWGCFFAGLEDETYGIPSQVPWAVDLGDGVMRHPVQLYESFSMLAFLLVALVLLARRDRWFMANGFYALVAFYAAQRFCWEFLKPYAAVVGPFNLFHLVCAGLIAYACVMLGRGHERAAA
jgi:phosphatidylglycerol---prolipoprotein diacylglyceryl transferase